MQPRLKIIWQYVWIVYALVGLDPYVHTQSSTNFHLLCPTFRHKPNDQVDG